MTDPPLKMFSPQVYYFFAAIRQVATSNTITLLDNTYPHTASICGGFALAFLNASRAGSSVRANSFGDVDIFTSMRFHKTDILQVKSAFKAFGGRICDEDPEMYFGGGSGRNAISDSDSNSNSETSTASTSSYIFGDKGIIAIRNFKIYQDPKADCWSRSLVKVQIITMDKGYHSPPDDYLLWKSVVRHFDISVCMVSIPDEQSEAIAYTEDVKEDIARKQFSYRLKTSTFPPTMHRRIRKYLGKGYSFREIKFDGCKGVMSFSNATIP